MRRAADPAGALARRLLEQHRSATEALIAAPAIDPAALALTGDELTALLEGSGDALCNPSEPFRHRSCERDGTP